MRFFRNKTLLVLAVLLLGGKASAAEKNEEKYFSINKSLNVFNSVLREVNTYYVDSLKYGKLTETGINSMLQTLDPYTVYIPEELRDDVRMMTTGEYAGVGAMIMKKDGVVVFSEPYEGMPAQRNGIRAGDVILVVDGVDVSGKSTSEVSELLKGKNGTPIAIKLQRPGQKKTITKKFLRENIRINPVSYHAVLSDRTGYVLLDDFTEKSAFEFRNKVSEMEQTASIESLIIDLRGNSGGLIDEAVQIMGYFVPKGTEIVSTKGKYKESDRIYRTPSEPLFPNMRVAVLVDRGSASAAEILAGAMQDLDRGVIIGERTFGKGLVQIVRPISHGGHVKVTVGKYFIPSGRSVQALDYSNRNDDGSVGSVPDSLTSVFYTFNGRSVRDGGGITPDTITKDTRKFNVAYDLFLNQLYFDYATLYAQRHKKIDKPDKFALSDKDFYDFIDYLIQEKKYSYRTQSDKYFARLKEVVEYEGLDADAELEALKQKLNPGLRESLIDNRKDIEEFLTIEILHRYYYQKGRTEYLLKEDEDMGVARDLLRDSLRYNSILSLKN